MKKKLRKTTVGAPSCGNTRKTDTTVPYPHGNKAGITLVALVITIIVLLILAAITINLTVGQRGILTRAQEAGKNYQEAAKREDEELAKLWDEAENILKGTGSSNSEGTGGNTGDGEDTIISGDENNADPNNPDWTKPVTTTKKDNYEDTSGKKATIPEGFQVSKKEGETEIEDGLVIRDANTNNEFVWVPCTENGENGSIKYDRYAFSRTGWSYTQTKNETTGEINVPKLGEYVFTEAMPDIELNSIKKHGGFYIGRYEVGIVDYDANVLKSNSNNEIEWTGYSNGKAVVQKDKQVWNYITRDKAKKVAEGMYANNNAVISRLCSSYAWDTALKFIETKNAEYATNSEGDNYSGSLNHTGVGSTPRNNIYDMGGNVAEWTIEVFSFQVGPCTLRGGFYRSIASNDPAGCRSTSIQTGAYGHVGVRSTLFVGL